METRLKRRRAQHAPNHFCGLVRDVRNIIRGELRPIDVLMLDEAFGMQGDVLPEDALEWAIDGGVVRVLEYVLQHYVGVSNLHRETCWMERAASLDSVQVVECLLAHKFAYRKDILLYVINGSGNVDIWKHFCEDAHLLLYFGLSGYIRHFNGHLGLIQWAEKNIWGQNLNWNRILSKALEFERRDTMRYILETYRIKWNIYGAVVYTDSVEVTVRKCHFLMDCDTPFTGDNTMWFAHYWNHHEWDLCRRALLKGIPREGLTHFKDDADAPADLRALI